jgi:hypothetical protein
MFHIYSRFISSLPCNVPSAYFYLRPSNFPHNGQCPFRTSRLCLSSLVSTITRNIFFSPHIPFISRYSAKESLKSLQQYALSVHSCRCTSFEFLFILYTSSSTPIICPNFLPQFVFNPVYWFTITVWKSKVLLRSLYRKGYTLLVFLTL